MSLFAADGKAVQASRYTNAFGAVVLSLLLASKVAEAGLFLPVGQAPWVAAAFVLPLLYAVPRSRRVLDRYRWPVLAAQAALTAVPFAMFGAKWETGTAGLLAALVLLMIQGWVSWLAAGLLLAADLALRAGVTGLPWEPAWSGAMWVVVPYVDDMLACFGVIRLAQIVGEVDAARGTAADLAVTGERLHVAQALHAAVGQRLAGITANAAAARQALPRDAARARAQIAAAGLAAREAVAQARAVSAGRLSAAGPRSATTPPGPGAVIGERLALATLLAVLSAFGTQAFANTIMDHDAVRTRVLVATAIVLTVALQLRHSLSARRGLRPRAWPATLGLQAALVYVFFLPGIAAYMVLPGFLAGSVLLLVPGRWRWAGFAAVVVSWSALFSTVPLPGITAADRGMFGVLYEGGSMAFAGMLVYGLSRLASMARELDGLQDELARAAAVQERLRVARDVHDLLGLGLSAIALKADLAGALIGRDDTRAAAEVEQMARICATARADIRQITEEGSWLRLADELAAARQILTSAGIRVCCDAPVTPLPDAADRVLAPVLREAVTNILRHSTAAACTIEVAASARSLRLRVVNDGVTRRPAAGPAAGPAARTTREGSGLANLDTRVQSAGGQLTCHEAAGQFILAARIPLDGTRPARAWPGTSRRRELPAEQADPSPRVLEQAAGHPGR